MEHEVVAAGGDNLQPSKEPIIIGHSVGGLLTQIFMSRNLARLGVPNNSVAPNMMTTLDWPFFKISGHHNPIERDEPFKQTPKSFHENFCNTLEKGSALIAFEETATHDSRNVLRRCLGPSRYIDLDIDRVPMLIISGKEDQIVPVELVENNKAYQDGTSDAAYVELKAAPITSVANRDGRKLQGMSITGLKPKV